MNVTVWTAPHGTTRGDFYRGGRTSDDGAQAPRCILGLLCNDGFGKKRKGKRKEIKKDARKKKTHSAHVISKKGDVGV